MAVLDFSTAHICPFDSDELEYYCVLVLHNAIYRQAKPQKAWSYGLMLDLTGRGGKNGRKNVILEREDKGL
jgi:hypothetical protein